MKQWKKWLALSLVSSGICMMGLPVPVDGHGRPSAGVGAGCADFAPAEAAQNKAIAAQAMAGPVQVTGVARVYGDGEKIAAAVLEYSSPLAADAVSPAAFAAEGKKIAAAYVSDAPDTLAKSREGRYVVLEFANENTTYDGDLSKKPGRPQQAQTPRNGDAPKESNRKLPDLSLSVRQTLPLTATDGSVFAPSAESLSSVQTLEPELAQFEQLTYTDPATGLSMPYNLYLPQDYDSTKKYPLLVFIPDASANINDARTPLFQGNGATVWISPEEQAKHECIVLAPQYTADLVKSIGMMTTDENIWTPGLSLVSGLLFDAVQRYSVDESRIYGTGQSQGGMANIAISDRYPDFFAGQFLVACQWNVKEMEAIKDKNLWILVCEGDTKAFPGMNEATARWESLGSKVARNEEFWDSKAPLAEINAKTKELMAQNAAINYTVFKDGNHMYTWSFAYNIESIRDWLFRQRK